MVPATTTASQPDECTDSDKIVLKPRKRSRTYDSKPGGPEDTGNHTSKYLHQAIKIMQEKDKKGKKFGKRETKGREGEEKGRKDGSY